MSQNDWNHLSLSPKEYVDKEVRHLRELRELDKSALRLQAEEYERRLTELNHAHARAEQDRHQYITVAVYDATQKDVRALIETQRASAEKATNLAETNSRDIARLTNTLTWITRTVIGAILVAVVALLLRGTPMFPVTP